MSASWRPRAGCAGRSRRRSSRTTSAPRIWGEVLRPPSSPGLWPAGSSHPCARCGEQTAGIAPGDLCASCTRQVTRTASRVGRLVAIVTTLLVAGYLMFTLRSTPLASQTTARTVGAVAAVVWYLLTFRIVQRSEEHTSELQSLAYLVCRLLLEKKKKNSDYTSLEIYMILGQQTYAR